MANKVTKRDYFEMIKTAMADNTDVVAFCNREIELLDKKAERAKNATRKPTKTQIANEALANDVYDFVANAGAKVAIKDVADNFAISSQKATPIMNGLVDAGKLVKTVEKRKAFYTVA
jgi:hypothetical protein